MVCITLESYAESPTACLGLLSTCLRLAKNHDFHTSLTLKKYHL